MDSLTKIRKLNNKSQQEVADYLGISRPMYSFYESGRSKTPNTVIAKLADYYNVPVDVITGKIDLKKTINSIEPIESNLIKIPIVGHIRAGYDGIAEQYIEGYMDVEESIVNRFPGCFSLNVYGDSMEPEIHNGDRVIEYPCNTVNSGDVAIVCLNGDEATIKRVEIDDNGITIIPTNTKYRSMRYTPEQVENLPVSICGRVVQVRHDYF